MTDPVAIAWINDPGPHGQWGSPNELTLPINERGLLLADGLFETVLILDGQPRLLAEHLDRWHHSAALLGLAKPPDETTVEPLIHGAISRSGISCGALRLNWSRGNGGQETSGRGIAIPPADAEESNRAGESSRAHRFWLQLNPHQANFDPVRVIVSPTERRCASSLLSQCKTFAYGPSIQARRQAQAAGADDALLPSSNGGLSCGTTTNLLVRQGSGSGSGWITPPLSSGCLPGIMRQRALVLGVAQEQIIDETALIGSAGALLINSLGCRAISHLGPRALPIAPDAEALWRSLL
jgi:branched-subunit amino acid aminotransferase/4-amino-4-deoxychorismate lyase